MTFARSTILGLTLVLAAAGCGSSVRSLPAQDLENTIAAKFTRIYAPATVTNVECPSSLAAREDERGTCHARIGGLEVLVAVSTVGDQGKVRFGATRPVVIVAQVENDLVAQLHAVYDEPNDKVDVRVQCPGARVRMVNVGATFRCVVRVDGTRMSEAVTVADQAGNVSYRALQ